MGVLIVAGITATGHTIDMALMHFLLFYAGVFALIGLTTAVGVGLLASDRIVMTPSGRIIAQAVHRAVSFGAVGFLLIHIVTEIIAGRSQAADAVLPFLDQGRTLYLGLGTIASDLFLLILVTGILRARFATVRPTWAWRALHSAAYLAWVLGIIHGLLAGRTAKPYVDWSYGACVAAVGLALIVRVVAAGRVRETASSPVPEAPPWLTAGRRIAVDARRDGLHAGPGPGAPAGRRPGAPRAVSQRPPLALPAAPPRAIPAYPEPAGGARQSPERATGPDQYPGQVSGPISTRSGPPARISTRERATGPHQYPERVTGPEQSGAGHWPLPILPRGHRPASVSRAGQRPRSVPGAGHWSPPVLPSGSPARISTPSGTPVPDQYPERATGPASVPASGHRSPSVPRADTGPRSVPRAGHRSRISTPGGTPVPIGTPSG